MDTVATVVADVTEIKIKKGIYMSSLDDLSGFHSLRWQPDRWLLFREAYEGADLICTTVPFDWNDSHACYHPLLEASNVPPVDGYTRPWAHRRRVVRKFLNHIRAFQQVTFAFRRKGSPRGHASLAVLRLFPVGNPAQTEVVEETAIF